MEYERSGFRSPSSGKLTLIIIIIVAVIFLGLIVLTVVLIARRSASTGLTGHTGTNNNLSAAVIAGINMPAPGTAVVTWFPVMGASCYNIYYTPALTIPTVVSPFFTTCGVTGGSPVGLTGGISTIGVVLPNIPVGSYQFSVAAVSVGGSGSIGPLSNNFNGTVVTVT
jgi:hypothetical protein